MNEFTQKIILLIHLPEYVISNKMNDLHSLSVSRSRSSLQTIAEDDAVATRRSALHAKRHIAGELARWPERGDTTCRKYARVTSPSVRTRAELDS